MQQLLATSSSQIGAHSRENEILSEVERILDEHRPASPGTSASKRPSVFRRIAPLVALAGVGAALALALAPAGVKDVLITGRSVAHSTNW